ncbi:MAG: NAD-dependent epimerase/dehydratase family protein [Pseudomonadota bacterium]
MSGQVLILGASGMSGRASVAKFEEAGWRVKTYDRARDDMAKAARGCDVIVNAMNPQNYHDWANAIPRMTDEVLAAAKASGATIILPGNVYHFGDQGGIWSERTVPNPVCKKGEIRLAMEETYRKSGVQTVILRAGNFIDPVGKRCVLSLLYLRKLQKARIVLPGPASTRQAMCFIDDWARVAVALAELRGTLSQFEDIPMPGQTMTALDLRRQLQMIIGQSLQFEPFPWWLLRLASPVWEFAREMNEMQYLYQTDHSLSGCRLATLLPDFQPTPMEAVLKQVVSTL